MIFFTLSAYLCCLCALGPDHDLTQVNTRDLELTWSAKLILSCLRTGPSTHRSSGSCTGVSNRTTGHSIFKHRKKNVRGRCLAIQHNLVLVSLLLTYHLTIWNDPRQLLSSRRIFRQRSAKPDLAHSYHPYHNYWANTETKPVILPFLDKTLSGGPSWAEMLVFHWVPGGLTQAYCCIFKCQRPSSDDLDSARKKC